MSDVTVGLWSLLALFLCFSFGLFLLRKEISPLSPSSTNEKKIVGLLFIVLSFLALPLVVDFFVETINLVAINSVRAIAESFLFVVTVSSLGGMLLYAVLGFKNDEIYVRNSSMGMFMKGFWAKITAVVIALNLLILLCWYIVQYYLLE